MMDLFLQISPLDEQPDFLNALKHQIQQEPINGSELSNTEIVPPYRGSGIQYVLFFSIST